MKKYQEFLKITVLQDQEENTSGILFLNDFGIQTPFKFLQDSHTNNIQELYYLRTECNFWTTFSLKTIRLFF